MAKFDGRDLLLLLDSVAIGNSLECTVTVDADEVGLTDKDDAGWDDFINGNKRVTITANGYTDYSASWGHFTGGVGVTNYYTKLINNTEITARFTTNSSGDDYIQVTAILKKFESNGRMNEGAGYSIELKSKGAPTTGTI